MNSTLASSGPTHPHASATVSNTGTPSTSPPPLPGVTPATTCVPYARINRVRAMPSRPVMPCTSTRCVLSVRIAISRLAALRRLARSKSGERQMHIPAPVSLEIAFHFARQALDTATAPGFFARDVQHRHLAVERKNLRNARFHADLRRAIAAERMIIRHRAAGDRLKRVWLLWLTVGVGAHRRFDHRGICDQIAQA